MKETDDEAFTVYGRTDYRDIEGARGGLPSAEVCRKHGISHASFYKYKAKFGGMDVSDARKLRALEDENGKLKKLLAEAMLDRATKAPLVRAQWRGPS